MALFKALNKNIGNDAGPALIAAFRTIAANFALAEPSVTAHNAAGNRTLALGDKMVDCNNASAQTVTIPPSSSVAFEIGTKIDVLQSGAGVVTIAAGNGVTIQKISTKSLALAAQHAVVSLRKTATNTWKVTGELT